MSQPTAARDGRSTRWDEHRRERRHAIIAAAIDAIQQYGPDALTGQIAEKAGVPRTHVYRHFEDKSALDRAVSRAVSRQISEQIRSALAVPGSPRQLIAAAITQHFGWIEAHPNLYRFLAQHAYNVNTTGSSQVDDAKAAFATELTRVLSGYLEAFGVSTEPAERVLVGVVAMVDAMAIWWLEHRDTPREQVTEQLTEQVWLIIDHAARQVGLVIDPDGQLPAV